MAKATTTIRQVLNYQPHRAAWFAANQTLFNQIAAFYFEVIQAHEKVLDLSNKEALTALEMLTHATKKNPIPVMPLAALGAAIPAMFRRAAINAALGSARSFYSHLQKWRKRKEKAMAKGQTFTVDLNLNEQTAVCTIQTVEGTILATRFIGGGREISGFRKKQLGRIARNRRKTGIIAEGEQDNAALWRKLGHRDEDLAHRVSARIVQFAKAHGATVLVFEHLGHLKPEKGKYSRRGNSKRAFWMKGRIFRSAKYKAYNEGILTSRVNPRNTSRECARCHGVVVRYQQGQPAQGYTPGVPLVLCPQCAMKGNADRNASLVIGQRLIARYGQASQEKPQTPLLRQERGEKSPGVAVCQDAKGQEEPSLLQAGHADSNEHGTAQDVSLRIDEHTSDILRQLRFPFE